MNAVERVKSICKERKLAISKLEADCGFSNGYIGQLRKGTFPDDRLRKIAEYLGLSPEFLSTGKEDKIDFSEQADLLIKIRNDKRLMGTIEKYYALSDRKKAHVLDLIDVLSEE